MQKIVLIGFGGHAKGIIDTIELQKKYEIVGFIEKKNSDTFEEYKDYKVIGQDENLAEVFRTGIMNAFITIGYMGKSSIRNSIYKQLKEIGFHIPVIIDPSAAVAQDVYIEEGTYIGKNAVINAEVHIGRMCIINSGAIIEHECRIGDFTHIAVGAIACGNVKIGCQSFLGANSTIIQGKNVGNRVLIGAGSIVLDDVLDDTKVYGIYKGKD